MPMTNDDSMADITERLQRAAPFMRSTGRDGVVGQHANTCEEAADEITRLRALLTEAADALRPFADIIPSTLYAPDGSEREPYDIHLAKPGTAAFTGADMRRARDILARITLPS